jgi:hypothetical protein
MSFRVSTLAAVAYVGLLAAGCEDTDRPSSSRDRDHDGIADRYDRRPDADDRRDDDVIISRDRDRARDRDLDRDRDLRGLAEIPRDAVRVEQGVGETLRYDADRDGRIYVYDQDDDRVVYQGKLYGGEDFVIDPDRDVLSVNGKRLDDINLRAKHRYRLYFMRD